MSAEELFHCITDPIPGIGTIVSFGLAVSSAFEGNGEKAVAYALDGYQGLVRDAIFVATDGVGLPITLTLLHNESVALTDLGVKWLFSLEKTETKKNNQVFQLSKKGRDLRIEPLAPMVQNYENNKREHIKYAHVLIPHPDGDLVTVDNFVHNVQKSRENDFGRTVALFGALFSGKITYAKFAVDENIFLVFPTGFHSGAICYVLFTFTMDYSEKAKVPITYRHLIEITDRVQESFVIKPPRQELYEFRAKFKKKWEKIEMTMWRCGTQVEAGTITLELYENTDHTTYHS